jgi:hypothetical protein
VPAPSPKLGVFLTAKEFRAVQHEAFGEGVRAVHLVLRGMLEGDCVLNNKSARVMKEIADIVAAHHARKVV